MDLILGAIQNSYLSTVKVKFIIVILSVLGHGNLFAQNPKEDAWKLILSLNDALVKKDSSRLKILLAEDFVGSIPSGKVFSKQEYIRYHCKPDVGLVDLKEYPKEDAIIRIYDEVAIVNRKVHAKLKRPDGSLAEFDVQRTEVCVRKSDRWQLASGQGTEVNMALRP